MELKTHLTEQTVQNRVGEVGINPEARFIAMVRNPLDLLRSDHGKWIKQLVNSSRSRDFSRESNTVAKTGFLWWLPL